MHFCMVQSQKIWTVHNLFNIKPLNFSSLVIDVTVRHLLWTHFIGCPYGRVSITKYAYVSKCTGIHRNARKFLLDFILYRLKPVTGPITRSSNDSTPGLHTYCCTCWMQLYWWQILICHCTLWNALPKTSERQNRCVQKDVGSLTFIQNTDLLCIICFCFPPCDLM